MHTAELLSKRLQNLLTMDKNDTSEKSSVAELCLTVNLIFNVYLVLDWPCTQDNMKEYVLLVFLALCSAKPLFRPSYMTLKNVMLKDMEDEGDADVDNSLFPTREPINPFFSFDLFSTCPFGCQCYSRVVHCSDLGKNMSTCFGE